MRSPTSLHTVRVLIAEDETSIRESLARYLRRKGADVLEARNGREALDQIEGGEVDVLVLDLHMPMVGGLAVLRALQGRACRPAVIVTSGSVGSVLEEADRLGADAVLEKPYDLEELARRISVVAGARRAA